MKIIFAALLMSFVTSCSSTNIMTYKNEKPNLILEKYLNGKMKAHGLVMDRSGSVTRRFVVSLNTTWKENVGTLIEDFDWADGEKTQRIWTIKKLSEGRYEGTASDILDVAIGESAGNAFHWTYKIDLKVKDSNYRVSFDDWMYLVNEKVLINRAQISWYGFHAGEVLISFTKE